MLYIICMAGFDTFATKGGHLPLVIVGASAYNNPYSHALA